MFNARADAWVMATIVILFVAVALAFILARRHTALPPTASQPATPTSVPARPSEPPTTQSVLEKGFIGVILPRATVDIGAEVEGRVLEVRFGLGDRVAPGEIIAVLDDISARQELAIAAETKRRLETELDRAQVVLAEAESNYEREEGLFHAEPKQTSRTAYERAQRVRDVAEKDVQIAAVRLDEHGARMQQLRTHCDKTVVSAPFDGLVAERYQGPGAVVAAGVPIVRLISSDLVVRFAIPEEDAVRVWVGSSVAMRVPTIAEQIPGEVVHIAPEVDGASGMVTAEARLDISEELRGRIRSGMVGHVFLGNHSSVAPSAPSARSPD